MNLCARKSVANVKREPRRGRTGASGGPDAVHPPSSLVRLIQTILFCDFRGPTPPPPHGPSCLFAPASDARCLGLLDRVLELASLRPTPRVRTGCPLVFNQVELLGSSRSFSEGAQSPAARF